MRYCDHCNRNRHALEFHPNPLIPNPPRSICSACVQWDHLSFQRHALTDHYMSVDFLLRFDKQEFLDWYGDFPARTCTFCSIKESQFYQLWRMRSQSEPQAWPFLDLDWIDDEKPCEIDNLSLACTLCKSLKNSRVNTSLRMTIEERKRIGRLIGDIWEECQRFGSVR